MFYKCPQDCSNLSVISRISPSYCDQNESFVLNGVWNESAIFKISKDQPK